jgi:hypothetical protein
MVTTARNDTVMHAYLDLRAISEIPGDALSSSTSLMSACGGNTGNLLFRHALKSFLDLSGFEAMNYADLSGALAEGKVYESILISAANWIGASELRELQCKTRADLILKAALPVVILGLGAQAPLHESDLKLGPETLRFMAVLSSHCKFISVRDEFTARLFERHGFHNVITTGCPSNFINSRDPLEEVIAQRAEQLKPLRLADVAVSHCEIATGHPMSQTVLAKTLRELREIGDSQYIGQSSALVQFFCNEEESLPKIYSAAAAEAGFSEEELGAMLRKKLRYFSSVPEWLGSVGQRQLVAGMRIHGAMAGIQAGVPSLLIGHDSRTQGLAQVMGIPMISPEEYVALRGGFLKRDVLPRLAELIQRQITGYAAKRSLLRKAFDTVLFSGSGYRPPGPQADS